MKPLYIFDLDGTLALNKHREHYLLDLSDPDRWRKFFAACIDDEPNSPVIETLERLSSCGCEIWIFSGRSDEVFSYTLEWIDTFIVNRDIDYLRMRPIDDYRPDEDLKLKWLNEMEDQDRGRLVAVFDDRDKVVKMWRDNGITCFQVAPGDF